MFTIFRRTMCGPNVQERTEIIHAFTNSNPTQSSAEFLAACNLTTEELDAFIAIRTRAAIAELAEVPPEFILSSYVLDEDLRWNPGWDSLDVVQLTMLLEDHLDVRVPDEEWGDLPVLYFKSVPVVDFVRAVRDLVKPKLKREEPTS